MENVRERMVENPVIAAVKDGDGLEKAIRSDCDTVFLLASTIMDVEQLVGRLHAAG